MDDSIKSIYKEEYDIWGYPQEYKGLKIYPIKIKDIKYQNLFYRNFAYPKNYIPDKSILKMSYLKFLLYIVETNVKPEDKGKDLLNLLKYLLKEDDMEFNYKERENSDDFDIFIKAGDILITESDFEDIRAISLEQNGLSLEYVESYNPELEDKLAFINKDAPNVNFADEVFTFCSMMKKTLPEIENYTIYQFRNQMEKLITLHDYDVYRPLEVSGQISIKGGQIKHYLYNSKKSSGRYDSVLISKDEFVKKGEVFQVTQ